MRPYLLPHFYGQFVGCRWFDSPRWWFGFCFLFRILFLVSICTMILVGAWHHGKIWYWRCWEARWEILASRIKGYQFNLESSKMHIIDFHQKGKATWSPRHRERGVPWSVRNSIQIMGLDVLLGETDKVSLVASSFQGSFAQHSTRAPWTHDSSNDESWRIMDHRS
jgi:hypothetical protein